MDSAAVIADSFECHGLNYSVVFWLRRFSRKSANTHKLITRSWNWCSRRVKTPGVQGTHVRERYCESEDTVKTLLVVLWISAPVMHYLPITLTTLKTQLHNTSFPGVSSEIDLLVSFSFCIECVIQNKGGMK